MSKIKVPGNNLSKEEGDHLKSLFGKIIDWVVEVTGGKPTLK